MITNVWSKNFDFICCFQSINDFSVHLKLKMEIDAIWKHSLLHCFKFLFFVLKGFWMFSNITSYWSVKSLKKIVIKSRQDPFKLFIMISLFCIWSSAKYFFYGCLKISENQKMKKMKNIMPSNWIISQYHFKKKKLYFNFQQNYSWK